MATLEFPAEARILRISHVVAMVGKSRSAIYAMLDMRHPSYDPTFPRPISLGKRSVGWFLSDLQAWLTSRPRKASGAAIKEVRV